MRELHGLAEGDEQQELQAVKSSTDGKSTLESHGKCDKTNLCVRIALKGGLRACGTSPRIPRRIRSTRQRLLKASPAMNTLP